MIPKGFSSQDTPRSKDITTPMEIRFFHFQPPVVQTCSLVMHFIQSFRTAGKVTSAQPSIPLSLEQLCPPISWAWEAWEAWEGPVQNWCWPTLTSDQNLGFRWLGWNLGSMCPLQDLGDVVSPAASHWYQMLTPVSAQGGCTWSVPHHPLTCLANIHTHCLCM